MATAEQPQSLNRYGYVNNNATNLTDPLGSFLLGEDPVGGGGAPVGPQDRVSCELAGGVWSYYSSTSWDGYCEGPLLLIYRPNQFWGGGGRLSSRGSTTCKCEAVFTDPVDDAFCPYLCNCRDGSHHATEFTMDQLRKECGAKFLCTEKIKVMKFYIWRRFSESYIIQCNWDD